MAGFTANDAFQYLVAQGYQPHQAAALIGNMMQESSLNPSATNPKEGAYGLIQWRQSRLRGLQDFARSRGTDSSDPQTQMDFIGQEMQGPEAKSGSAFLSAPDLPSANAALKQYIRYGDNSENTRLSNALGLLNQALQPPVQAISGQSPTQLASVSGPSLGGLPIGLGGEPEQGQDLMKLFQNFGSIMPDQQMMQQIQPPLFAPRKKVTVNVPRTRRA